MPSDDWDDDEDWYDDEDVDEAAPCPECGEPVATMTSKCPACGYWLNEDDRRRVWSSERRPLWQRATAVVVLAALIALLLSGLF